MQSGNGSNKEEILEKALDMHRHGTSLENIEKELLKWKVDTEIISEVVKDLRLEIHKKNLKDGRALILAGCIVMAFGFILTCVKFHANESINMVMFGFTTLGICILFVGLYKVFN